MSTLIKPGGSTGPGKAWKKGVAGGAVLAVLAGSALASAMPAMAAGESVTASVTTTPPNGYYTGQIMSDGTIGYCDTDPQGIVVGTADYSTPHAVRGSFTALGGSVWSGDGLREAAYILSKYGNTQDLTQSVAVHRAQTQLANPGSYDPGQPGLASQALANTYMLEAAAKAGAVEAGYSANLVVPGKGPTGTVTVSGPAGYAGTATINGPAVWANTNSAGTQFTTGQPLPQIVVTGSGAIKVTGTVDGLPDTTLWVSESPTSQDLFKAGRTHSAAFETGDVQVSTAFQPTATSTAGQFVEGGQPLTDVLHVTTSTGVANDWIVNNGANVPARFDVDWYYSPVALPASANIPASAVKFSAGTGTATGPGDVTVTADKPADKDGHYYPVARFSKAAQPADLQQYFTGDWTAGFNDPGEHTIQKYTPKVTTKAMVDENGKAYDLMTVTDNGEGLELTIVTDRVLTSEESVEGGKDEAPADAKIIGTKTTKVVGNGVFRTEAFETPWEMIITEKWQKGLAANTYFSEKIAATETTKAWDGKELLPNETIPVQKPSIKTKASANITVGEKAHDTGVVSGTIPSGDGIKVTTLVNQFKFDDSTDGSAQAVCANPSWTSTVQTVTTAGEITYPEHVIENKGTYGHVEELNITIDKGPGNEPFTAPLHKGKCGEKDETVIVFPKEVPPTPEKPQLHVPDQPGTAPVAYTGEVTAQQGINAPLLFGGAAVLAGIVIGGIYYQRRRAAALNAVADAPSADEQH